jgi:hypothetical protein
MEVVKGGFTNRTRRTSTMERRHSTKKTMRKNLRILLVFVCFTARLLPCLVIYQIAEKHLLGRLIKNVQMQGTRNSEE